MRCSKCGSELPPNAKYCGVCGKKLNVTKSKLTVGQQLDELLDNLETELKFSELQRDILKNQEVFVDSMDALIPFLKKKAFFIVIGTWEGCELFYKPAAYKIAEEIKKLKVRKDPVLITDKYFDQVKYLQ